MFRNSRTLLAVAAAAIVSAGIGIAHIMPSAEAQSSGGAPVILVVDQARLIGTSKAGQSIAAQMENLQQKANTELTTAVDQLVSEAQELDSKKASMEEGKFNQEAQKVLAKRQEAAQLREIKVRELNIAEQNALAQVSQAMRPILKEIVDSRGATVLLERQDILYANPSTDITEEALQKLDAQLATVKVEPVDLKKAIAEARAAAAQQQQ